MESDVSPLHKLHDAALEEISTKIFPSSPFSSGCFCNEIWSNSKFILGNVSTTNILITSIYNWTFETSLVFACLVIIILASSSEVRGSLRYVRLKDI